MTTISPNASANKQGRRLGNRGNVLIYVLMTMVIFAVVGVTMVSLMSTSISSSATANETRRAVYLAESGLRYAMSELRQNGFSQTNINRLNTTDYKVPPSGSFQINVFGAWFKSPSVQTITGGALTVELVKGKIPTGFFARLTDVIPDLYLVLSKLGPSAVEPKPAAKELAKVRGFTPGSDTSFQFDLADDLSVEDVTKTKIYICMAVQPFADRTFTPSGDANAYLDLKQSAAKIFPKTDGAFKFDNRVYFYRSAKEETGFFRLSNITPEPNKGSPTNPVTVSAATDYILLAPNNFFVTSKGTSSNNVEFNEDLDTGVSLASHNPGDYIEDDIVPTIVDMRQNESSTDYFSGGTDTQGDYIKIGPTTGMGAMWYNQNLALGGSTNFCTSTPDINSRVGCLFGSGMRAVFTLEYSGSGEGLIFALLNGQLNQFSSSGGDFEAPELLGYAGDSRLNNSGNFVDTTGVRGLRPPKMGLELDARRNYAAVFEAKPTDFCNAGSLRQNTRNDPDPATDKDFMQYVYWGSDTVNVPCRTTPSDRSSTYDDNRHNPGVDPPRSCTPTSLGGVVNTSAAVSSDGKTIYVASNNTDIDPSTGSLKTIELDDEGCPKNIFTWTASNGVTSPVLDSSGNIYVGAGNSLYAFRPNRSIRFSRTLWPYTRASKPIIGPDGKIYISTTDGVTFGHLYAFLPDGSPDPNWSNNPQSIPFFFVEPVLTPDGSLIIAATEARRVFALRTTNGSPDPNWPGGFNGAPIPSAPSKTPGVGPGATSKGRVYIGGEDKSVYALSGEDGSILLTSPVIASEGLSSQPVVSSGTLYVGSFDDHLYALNTSNLSLKWSYYAAGNVQSAPTVDSNGTVYFGSDLRDPSVDNRNVNALYSDGTPKWQYSTGSGDVRGTPAVMADGTVYIGSFNFNFYAINQFAVPKSLKDKSITYDSGNVGGVPVTVDNGDDWLKGSNSKGPWAVRMEVYRSTSPNTLAPIGYYSYLLRTWARQCEQADCNDVIGSLYDDTHLVYNPTLRPPQMEQTINLSPSTDGDNAKFERFLFGFTSQSGSGDNQTAVIRRLKLSFVRSTDPIVTCDPNWPALTTCP